MTPHPIPSTHSPPPLKRPSNRPSPVNTKDPPRRCTRFSSFRVPLLLLVLAPFLIGFNLLSLRADIHIIELGLSSPKSFVGLTRPIYLPSYLNPLPSPSVTLRRQSHFPGSFGESIRIHYPFIISRRSFSPSRLLRLTNETFTCTNYNPAITQNRTLCLEYLRLQSATPGPVSYPNRALTTWPRKATCADATALVFQLHHRDRNVCHWLMRLMLAWHVLVRGDKDPSYLPIAQHRLLIFLCPSNDCMRRLRPTRGNLNPLDNFHVGVVRLLFRSLHTHVVVARKLGSVAKLLRSDRYDIGMSPTFCFRSGLFLVSFANRLAFPDMELGEQRGWNASSSQPAPLSSDLLSLRRLIFSPNPPMPMQRKLIYVARWGGRRTFTAEAETKFRELLHRVANESRFHVEIFEGNVKLPFSQQLNKFESAAVIVGFHGAGLSQGIFAPKGARMVEIEPDYHQLGLFGTVQSAGVAYEMFKLSAGTEAVKKTSSHLSETDSNRFEKVLRRNINAVITENDL